MKKFIKILLFGLLCICFNPQSVFAGKGNTYAFLCTGSEIESEPMQNNVNGMVEVLKKNKITDNIYTTVYRTTSQSKKKDIDNAMSNSYKYCTKNDTAVFY